MGEDGVPMNATLRPTLTIRKMSWPMFSLINKQISLSPWRASSLNFRNLREKKAFLGRWRDGEGGWCCVGREWEASGSSALIDCLHRIEACCYSPLDDSKSGGISKKPLMSGRRMLEMETDRLIKLLEEREKRQSE